MVLNSLSTADFTAPHWRRAFGLLKDQAKGVTAPSTIQLLDYLREHDFDPRTILDGWDATYNASELREVVKKVKERTQLARLGILYTEWLKDVHKADTSVSRHVVQVMDAIYRLQSASDNPGTAEVLDKIMAQREEWQGKSLFGVPTGLSKLDFLTSGMCPKTLWTVGGYTSVGKSWVVSRMVKELIEHGVPTLWLSFEMSAPELMWRLAIQSLDRPDITIAKAKVKSLDEEQEGKFQQMIAHLRSAPLTIVDSLSTWEEARTHILHGCYSLGIKAVFVDYLQNVLVEGGGRMSTEFDSLSTIVRDMQRLAVSRDFFACCVSQVNRQSVKDDNDKVFGYRGSSSIENASDVALVLKKVGSKPDDPRRFLVVGKNRSGNTGRVQLQTDFNYGGISEVSGEIWPDE